MKKIIALLLSMSMIFAASGCSGEDNSSSNANTDSMSVADASESSNDDVSDLSSDEDTASSTIVDREGNTIEIPDEINSIVSGSPSNTEILSGLGLAEKIVGADKYSADVEGINAEICTLDLSALDSEYILSLGVDMIVISGINQSGENDPYEALEEAGVDVLYIPTATSIADIKADIEFLGGYTGKTEEAQKMIASIDEVVEKVQTTLGTVDEPTSVYFEISAAPWLYSFGNETFLDEIITLCGGKNIYANENGWISNSEESVFAANPEVILSSVDYEGYSYTEIYERAGWETLSAVANERVYLINANASSRASQNIVLAIEQIAQAINPDVEFGF